MKDVKVLHFSSCMTDMGNNTVVLSKWGVNSTFVENKALEALLLPYLNYGYRITQFSGEADNCVIILEKD